MSQTTYLDYTCAPNPLIEGANQDIVVIATLKSESELGASLTSATIDQIVLDFGTVGSGATQLTETAFSLDNIEAPPNWTPTVSGATCTLTPVSGHGEITTNAIIVKIKNVIVNSTSGNVTLAINEAATPAPQTSGEPPTTTPGSPGIENIILPKVAPGQTEISFSADPTNTSAGNGTTLSWSGGSTSDTYTLLYLKEGILRSITSHADGSTLGASGPYPNTDLSPPDSTLVLNATTTFILQIQKSGGEVISKTTTVIISQPNIYAQSVHATDSLNAGTATIGPLTLNGAAGGKLGAGSRVVFASGGDTVSIEENFGLNLYGSSSQPVKIRNANLEVLNGRINVNEGMAVNKSVNLCQAPDYSEGTVHIGGSSRLTNTMFTVSNNQTTGFGTKILAPNLTGAWWALDVHGQCINTSGSWSRLCDMRLKEDINTFEDGLSHILQINPIKYKHTKEADLGTDEHIGVSAQELQKIAPYMVGKARLNAESDEEYLAMDSGPMTYMLINAVKELNEKIESLENEVKTLKG